MPVREKAVEVALRTILGGAHTMSFNNMHMTAKVNGESMSREEFQRRFWDPIDYAYEQVVDSIDWNRVLLEATSRHIAVGHYKDQDDRADYGGQLCPECVCEALLATNTFADWDRKPNVRRYRDGGPQAEYCPQCKEGRLEHDNDRCDRCDYGWPDD